MAEAHSAVAFSFSITHEGWDVNFDREVLHLVWQSGIRSWKKRIARFKNSFKNGVYPAPMHSLWGIVAIFTGMNFSGHKAVSDVVNKIVLHLPGNTVPWQVGGCVILGVGTWLSIIFTARYTLKMLFMYKGWMYEQRGRGSRVSWQTKLWVLMVKIFSGGSKPMLYSYQGSLPRLPLPSVEATMKRYLRSVHPLLSTEDYMRMEKLAAEFQNGIGKKLQRYLVLKSWWSTNYVSDWWEEYVYLRGRSPLMVNSNFYGIDAILIQPTQVQSARAATVIYSSLQYRRLIDRQELEPIMVQGIVPLCSSQYERVFNTTRVPGVETDRIVHYSDSNHIIVYHRGRYFKVMIYFRNRILRPCEIEAQIQYILDDHSPPANGEEKLAALTAGPRTTWANTRKEFFFKGTNRQSLDAIEKAAFIVALDDIPYEYDPKWGVYNHRSDRFFSIYMNHRQRRPVEHRISDLTFCCIDIVLQKDPTKLDHYGRILLHGKGYDRWFDKSFTLCVGTNGRIGFNAEHTWADAAIMSHLWEHNLLEDAVSASTWADAPVMGHLWEYCIGCDLEMGYGEDGHTVGNPEINLTPARLQWDLPPACITTIDNSYQIAQALLNDVDLRILVHNAYGKGFMKGCRVSPDAYIQMALQLAYYRDAGKFSLTYEASMTRLFREGRTETVRPCTVESSEWVKSMSDKKFSVQERIEKFQKACQVHQSGYQDAMCGKGIDRHLFCLYVVSKYLEVDSPFLKEVLSEPWRLSTSQTPHGQTTKLDLKLYPLCICAGGGFGPVADDGYGVSYIIAGEDILFFHVTSKHSSPETNSSGFVSQIERALADIRNLFLEGRKAKAQDKK